MLRILETQVNLEHTLGHHLHCLLAQIPVHLRRGDHGWVIADRDGQWRSVRSVLDLVAEGEPNLRKLHFLLFPESAVPVERFEDTLAIIADRFRTNTVTMFGLEHVRLRTYRDALERFRDDNAAALELVQNDVESADVLDKPVNWCCVAAKEATGRLRVFLEAKTHPFRGEEFLDAYKDLYRGRHFWLFRSHPSCFNFMVLICLDYLWRDLYASNIRHVISRANQLFFTTRQTLDAIFVVQSNPKPEHRAYRDVLTGFYGEYLEDTPGVRETVTVFANCSEESAIEGYEGEGSFGASQVVIGPRHKLAPVQLSEFSTDDFGGAPLCRVRFGTGTRLYYFNLPLHHELDPRSSRLPLKIHSVLRRSEEGSWTKVSGSERLVEEVEEHRSGLSIGEPCVRRSDRDAGPRRKEDAHMPRITPFLWFDSQAEEAANFYVSVFPHSRIVSVSRYGDAGPGPKGSVMTVAFELDGREFIALNGGPQFKFTEAISFSVDCKTQEEVDRYWDKLSEGGEQGPCGWLKDRYGLSWQINPTVLGELLNDRDPEKAKRVMEAMLKMKKIEIEGLKKAYRG